MSKHKSVLLDECIENLNLKDDSIIVDCTLGYGGHSSEILKRINKGFLFAFDQDSEAILNSKKRLDEISNNYKLLYTVHELWSLTYNEISDTDNHMDWFGDVTISETILLENAKKIFDKVELPPSFNKDLFYMGTSGLVCTNGICTFNQSTFGVTGISPFSGYENKLTTEGNNIKVEQLYIEDEYVNYNEENDTYIFDIKLYDKKGGNLIKEFKSYEIDLNGEFDPYETFFIYYDKVQTYIYKFDDNNKLLEVTKVDE